MSTGVAVDDRARGCADRNSTTCGAARVSGRPSPPGRRALHWAL